MADHNKAWELVHPEPCNCEQSLALAKRLEVYRGALEAIKMAIGPKTRLDWEQAGGVVGSIVALAEANLGRLR